MCGVVGAVQREQRLTVNQFDAMVDTLDRRGPDGRGVVSLDDGRVMLGHRRLSIIDLSDAAAQPMSNEDSSLWLTFNGEIYNYRSLRDELIKAGHRFSSGSDSEVIIHAYEEWGVECLQRFRGIFAFGLWDSNRRELFLARDPLGVKPLYFATYNDTLSFASQPKAIVSDPAFRRSISLSALSSFLSFGYVPLSESIFENMSKLLAGHYAVYADGRLVQSRYYKPPSDSIPRSFEEAVLSADRALADAVSAQLVSDVPVGCYLSGGIDSSLLTALAVRSLPELRTFTVGFSEKASDERKFARLVSRHFSTQHAETLVTRSGLEHALWSQQEHFDEPFDPISTLPSLEVANLARNKGTFVTLGGDGADELFCGYLRYDDYDRPLHSLFGSDKHQFLRKHGLRRARRAAKNDVERFFRYEGCMSQLEQRSILVNGETLDLGADEIETLLPFYDDTIDSVVAAQILDQNLFLIDHVLCKVDRASMAHGVEARVPFLDPRVVAAANAIPLAYNYRRGERKAVLKAVARRYLPASVITNRKKGFSSPLWEWSDPEFTRWADRVLSSGYLVASGILRDDWLKALSRHPAHAEPGSRSRILLLTAELWARRWIYNESDCPALTG